MATVKPLATIVLPLLSQNNDWLRQCLLSALNQTVPCEVIVVTSAKTPRNNLKLLEILMHQFGGFKIILRDPGDEFAGAINKGFRHATTDRVGILLTDDWLAPVTVEECLKFSDDIVSTSMVIYSEESIRKPISTIRTKAQFDELSSLEEKASFIEHFFLFNKNKVLEIGGVDSLIGKTGADDYDMIWCLLEHKATVALVEQCLYHYRDHSDQRLTLSNTDDCRRDLAAILDKHNIRGDDKARLLSEHGFWCGRKIFDVIDDLETVGNSQNASN